MSLEHDFFGLIDDDGTGGLVWTETVEVADQPVTVRVASRDAAAVGSGSLGVAAAMVSALEGMDVRARDAMAAQLTERDSASGEYVDRLLDGGPEDADDGFDDLEGGPDDADEGFVERAVPSGDAAIDILRALRLTGAALDPSADGENEEFAVLEFAAVGEDESSLRVSFDVRGEVFDIELVD